MSKILTLSDELRGRLPRDPAQAVTAKQLFDRCEVAQTAEEVSKTLSALHRRGEVQRSGAAPRFSYWIGAGERRDAERSFAGWPAFDAGRTTWKQPAAAPAAAQPEVAQNTGGARPGSFLSRPESALAQTHPAAVPPSAAGGEVFRCALWNDGSLVIEAGGQRMELHREQTGLLFAYLERVAEVPGS